MKKNLLVILSLLMSLLLVACGGEKKAADTTKKLNKDWNKYITIADTVDDICPKADAT